jgi:hypothetical protein
MAEIADSRRHAHLLGCMKPRGMLSVFVCMDLRKFTFGGLRKTSLSFFENCFEGRKNNTEKEILD